MAPAVIFERAAFLGTGLIGGSAALAARAAGIVGTAVGVARTEATRRTALERGVVDEATPDARAAVEGADLVYVAVPLGSTRQTLDTIAPALSPDCLVTDAQSAKAGVVRDAAAVLPHPAMFVGGHPMAGAETAGVQYAQEDLFRGRAYFLTPTDGTSPEALKRAEAFVAALGARLLTATPDEHDDIVASISHVPHIAAVALMSIVARSETSSESRLQAAAGGFRDTTRIAASPAAMWREILEANREAVLRWLDAYTGELQRTGGMIRDGRWEQLEELLAAAAEARRRLQ